MNSLSQYILYPYCLAMTLLLTACGREEVQGLFEWDIEVPVDLPLNPNVFERKIINIYNIPTLIQNYLANGYDKSDIQKIELVQAALISEFQDLHLNFFREISLDVFDSNFEQNVEVAYKDPVEFSVKDRLDFFASLPDITPFFLEDQIHFRLDYRVRDVNPAIRARLFLRLKAIGKAP